MAAPSAQAALPDDQHALTPILPAEFAQEPTDIVASKGLVLTC